MTETHESNPVAPVVPRNNPPTSPPLATSDLPGLGGAMGGATSDFYVDEIPAYPASGEGQHWMVQVQKSGMTTRDLVGAIARAANVGQRDIGTAGMKDKYAVTTQWISVPVGEKEPLQWELPDTMKVCAVDRHDRKLRTGHVKGNRFRVRLIGVTGGLDEANVIAERLRTHGLPNFFGSQRFGNGGANVDRAIQWAQGGASNRAGRFKTKLYASVLQSEVFNRCLVARITDTDDTVRVAPSPVPRLGDVVRLDGSNSVFVVEDLDDAQRRLAEGDIHLTGPIYGPKMREAAGEVAASEAAFVASILAEDAWTSVARHGSGTRRDYWIRPDVSVSLDPDDETAMWLEFELQSGSYATQVAREFTRASWEEGRVYG